MTRVFRPAATALVFLLFLTFPLHAAGQEAAGSFDTGEEFTFDPGEFKKSPLEFGSYLQLDASYVRYRESSTLYRLNYFDEDTGNGRAAVGLLVQPEATWQKGPLKAFFLASMSGSGSSGDWTDEFTLMESSLSWQVDPSLYVSAGKILTRWGKGYAFSPVNFVGRDKNPADPDLAMEGFWMVLGDAVFSFPGSLKTAAFTLVALPVNDDLNGDFGGEEDLNWAGKLYLLLHNTDIDLMALSEGTRTFRLGADFSRNVTANFEIHGEWAAVSDFIKPVIAADGSRTSEVLDAENYLLGIRYLTPAETTFIVEYYRNGQGYTESEAQDYYDFVATATDIELADLRNSSGPYQRPNFMRDYLYLRASQKEPFGWLYVTPALTSIVNLSDSSYNVIPEVVYTGVTNLELRFRLNMLSGGGGTEYGEKTNAWKAEGRARYYF